MNPSKYPSTKFGEHPSNPAPALTFFLETNPMSFLEQLESLQPNPIPAGTLHEN